MDVETEGGHMGPKYGREYFSSDAAPANQAAEPAAADTLLGSTTQLVRSAGTLQLAAGLGGVVNFGRGLWSFWHGDFLRGASRIVLSAGCFWLAFPPKATGMMDTGQSQSGGDVAQRGVTDVERRPDDPNEATPNPESMAAVETPPEEVSYERLGEAAFNEHSNEVPLPQRIFNVELLALDDEVFWGVRERDDAVILSKLFDPIQEQAGVRYVGSSEIDGDRVLSIPGVVVDHWNQIGVSDTAVPSGTELVFLTSDEHTAASQVLVVPEQWSGEFLEASE
jgi:hypothetical protein